MADNVAITAGSGTDIATDQVTGTLEHVQLMKLAYSADGVRTLVTADANGILVDLGSNNDVTVSSIAAGDNNIGNVDVVTINGVAPAFDTGIRGATVQRVTICTDDVVPASQSGTWNITNISGTVSLPTGASTESTLSTLNGKVTACNTGAVVLSSGTVTTVSTVTSLTQMNGQAIAMGTGVRTAGTQRVTVATDDVVPVSQSGTWTVQPGNTANTTPWLTTQTPATSGGLTTWHLVSAASTNATVLKASAGQVYGWYIYNTNASSRKVAFHNTASTPTAGSSVFFSLVIPPSSGANVAFPSGIAFSTGIAVTTVTEVTDAGNTAVAANDLIMNVFYK